MAILAELEALTAKMAKLVPGPARGALLADFPREQAAVAAPPTWSPRRLLRSRRLLDRRNGVSLCRLPQLRVR